MDQYICNRNNLIRFYFGLGLEQQKIRCFLNIRHSIDISARHLKRVLKDLKLHRRKPYSNPNEILDFIRNQLETSSQLHGYRWMHLKCLQAGLVVRRNTVRLLLKELDPEGVSLRRKRRLRRRQYFNKGPNFLWHIDGYDKLKPYGIAISGCIDGYSRYIIWLRASYTNNNNPRIISGFFLTSVEACGGCPRTIRSDMGTENLHVEHIQTFLRSRYFENRHSLPAFIYGTSQHNQRIESWWSILRRENAQYWMNLFEALKDENLFNGTFLDKSLVQFCFLDLIQVGIVYIQDVIDGILIIQMCDRAGQRRQKEELDQVALEWNSHRISSSRHSRAPSGKPIMLYNLPELFGTKNYCVAVSEEEVILFKAEATYLEGNACRDRNVYNLCNILMLENNYAKPVRPIDALTLYKRV